jgi:chaperonin GroES
MALQPHQGMPEEENNMAVTVRPLYDRVIVKRVAQESTSKGGIIIPDSAKEKPQEGEVLAVGSGRRTDEGKIIALDVKRGDRILFGKYSGTDIDVDGEEHLIVQEKDILGVIEK